MYKNSGNLTQELFGEQGYQGHLLWTVFADTKHEGPVTSAL